jgi:hypothetical protein
MSDIARFRGTVAEFREARGIGFIAGTDGKRLFFTRGNLRPNPQGCRPSPPVGTTVTFAVAPVDRLNDNGTRQSDLAIDIEVL